MKPYEFKVAGLDEDGKIIVLVKDDQYGDYTFSVDFGNIVDDQLEINYDFVSNAEVPLPRQQEIVQHVVQHIIDEISLDIENDK